MHVEITENTLHAIPGITDPGQDGYHDTGTEPDDSAPARPHVGSDQRPCPRTRAARFVHGCGSLPEREVFDKSHNHQARSARRLVIEAT